LNKYFVAGAVYDPEGDECLEGAKITLTAADGSSEVLESDEFGDFWFERREPGRYSLKIEMAGYLPRSLTEIEVDKDLNLGDFQLYQKT